MKYEIRGASESTGEEQIFIVEARSKQLAESKARRLGMLISSIRRASRTAATMDEPETVVEHVRYDQVEPADDEIIEEDETHDEPTKEQPVPRRSTRRSSTRRSSRDTSNADSKDSGGLTFQTFITPKVIVVLFWVVTILILLGVLGGTLAAFVAGMAQSMGVAVGGAAIVFITGIILAILYILCIRIGCEVVVVLFRMRDHLENIESKLSDNDEQANEVG